MPESKPDESQPPEDDNKRKFREALERKKAKSSRMTASNPV